MIYNNYYNYDNNYLTNSILLPYSMAAGLFVTVIIILVTFDNNLSI